MKLTKEEARLGRSQVEKIAKLSRLELTEQEKELYANQLTKVLDYVDKLKSVDTENVPITAQVTGLENVYRGDDIDQCDFQKDLINQSTENEDNLIKTKSVF
ncbi:Asp-tRNA(Asn)/Glu-tRNA(Gln) amidotransferase subunit GatC [Candidatus Falkowbacteria bacterium]|nr:Asp-tRNA(Asn)/Glu-tRNA(Gln) amidotransferase subunit GatC [Candidatus Falkowbacteria bacterium]